MRSKIGLNDYDFVNGVFLVYKKLYVKKRKIYIYEDDGTPQIFEREKINLKYSKFDAILSTW